MKKIFLIFCFCFGLQAQETMPYFSNCTASNSAIDAEKCFYEPIKQLIRTSFNVSLSTQKATIATFFNVDEQGKFNLLYVDAPSEDLKNEFLRVFNTLPNINPAMSQNKPYLEKFTMKINLPFEDEKVAVVNNQTITKNTVLEEFDALKSLPSSQEVFKSNLNVPFHHGNYALFESFLNQVGSNNHTASKPYSYKEVASYYSFEEAQNKLLKNKTSWWGRKLWNENLISISTKDFWMVLNPIIDLRGGKDFASELNNTFVNTRGLHFFGALGKNVSFTTSLYESQGRFADYYNAYAVSLKPAGGNPALIPGIGIAKDFKTTAFDFPMAEAVLKFTANQFFDASLGYGRNFIGDGYRSLLQGDGTSPYPFIKLNTTFWKLKYTNTYMFLKDITPEQFAENTYASKYMANHYLSINVTKRLNLGFFESVVWSNTNGRGFDPTFINPIIFYRAVEFASSSKTGNALLGLTGKYKLNSKINTYAQFLIDEFSVADVSKGNKSWKNKFGYQLGAKYFNAFNIENLSLQAEINIVRPYVYSHSNTLTNYTHNNQSMGHNWGANFTELIGIARYNKARYFAQWKLIYGKRGFDFNDGTNTFNYGSNLFLDYDDNRPFDEGVTVGQGNTTNLLISDITAGYILNPATNMKIFANFIYRSFDPTKASATFNSSNTTWFSVGISTDLFNWYFDY